MPGSKQIRTGIGLRALRMEVLRFLLGGLSLGETSGLLGSSDLLADFCRVRERRGAHRDLENRWQAGRLRTKGYDPGGAFILFQMLQLAQATGQLLGNLPQRLDLYQLAE